MSNPNRVAGQITVIIDGWRPSTSGKSSMDIGGPSRESVAGDYEAGAYKESTVPSKTEVTLLYKNATDLARIRDMDNVTLLMEVDNGHTWIVRNAYAAEPPSFSQDGEAKVTFQGPPAELML